MGNAGTINITQMARTRRCIESERLDNLRVRWNFPVIDLMSRFALRPVETAEVKHDDGFFGGDGFQSQRGDVANPNRWRDRSGFASFIAVQIRHDFDLIDLLGG